MVYCIALNEVLCSDFSGQVCMYRTDVNSGTQSWLMFILCVRGVGAGEGRGGEERAEGVGGRDGRSL